MNHFKDFFIKLQTIDIQINTKKLVSESLGKEVAFYDISHENPFLNVSYNNELKQLKELAIIDILNLQQEQILFQVHGLVGLKNLFGRFWHNFNHSPVPLGSDHLNEYFFSLNLNEYFITPKLSALDHATVSDQFIDDLQDTIRAREQILIEFETAISKIVQIEKQPEKAPVIYVSKKQGEIKPIFKEGIAKEFFNHIKDYFSFENQPGLLNLLTSNVPSSEQLVFNGNGNQLADAFKQLFDANLVAGCNKAEFEKWILQHFQYRDKVLQKEFTEKYLKDIISSNSKACQSPLFDVRRSDGKLYLYALTRNNKNNKK